MAVVFVAEGFEFDSGVGEFLLEVGNALITLRETPSGEGEEEDDENREDFGSPA